MSGTILSLDSVNVLQKVLIQKKIPFSICVSILYTSICTFKSAGFSIVNWKLIFPNCTLHIIAP
jgi:hypothetical protein